jgi:hypothetical protein
MHQNNRLQSFFNSPTLKPVEATPTALEEKQELLAHHVRIVARNKSNGLFVSGVGGLGKSKTISETLASEGISPILINSHITPLSLYSALFYNRKDKIIWLDDCDAAYSSMQILGILRSALWGQGQRVVTYHSTQLPDDLPNSFEFTSRIIFCANCIPKRNEAFKAVLSRVDTFTLDASNDEVIEQMRLLANRGSENLLSEQCHEVVEFIAQQGGTRRLSMRLYEPSLLKYEYAQSVGIDWRDLVRTQLDSLGGENVAKPIDSKKHDIQCLREARKQFPHSVKQQQSFWCKTTGKSRASFFRTKKSIESN